MVKAQAQHSEPGGYDAAYFQMLAAAEDRHFWFTARNRVIAAIVEQLVRDRPAGYRVLEVGCGTGNVLRVLEDKCRGAMVIGADLFDEGLDIARKRVQCPLLRMDVSRPAFDQPFDLLCAFDVLEHIADDAAALSHLHAGLKPGGSLLLTVPASMSLWSYFDVAAHHCRRYEAAQLHERLTTAGFEVDYLTPFMAVMAPLIRLARRRQAPQAQQQVAKELRVIPGVNGLLKLMLAWERPLIRRRCRLPFGSSLLAVAHRPGASASG